jgi:hypothetical protein
VKKTPGSPTSSLDWRTRESRELSTKSTFPRRNSPGAAHVPLRGRGRRVSSGAPEERSRAHAGRTLPRLVSLPATNSTNRYGAMTEVLSNQKAWSTNVIACRRFRNVRRKPAASFASFNPRFRRCSWRRRIREAASQIPRCGSADVGQRAFIWRSSSQGEANRSAGMSGMSR